MDLPKPFPSHAVDDLCNPAIRLFGLRFVRDQTLVEYLSEFLAVALSKKQIGQGEPIATPLPDFETLCEWAIALGPQPLRYRPPVRLSLKLLAFLSSSPVNKRHDVHSKHYAELAQLLESSIVSIRQDPEGVRECIEDLLQGYQGAGPTRTWCAQTFYPVAPSLLTQETIWKETAARRGSLRDWKESLDPFAAYYSTTSRDFLARGGEVLYLQLCNVFSIPQDDISAFVRRMGLAVQKEETDLRQLHESLQAGIRDLYGQHSDPLDRLVSYIDQLDPHTYERTNDDSRALTCEWCPRDSYPEGYLFAVEINRLMSAALDCVDKLDLLMTGCALQVLRSLCAQSARYFQEESRLAVRDGLGYAWIFSPTSSSRQQRLTSQRNLQVIQGMIHGALRNEALREHVGQATHGNEKEFSGSYKEADDKYGHKLLIALGKRLGVIIPKKGPTARFVMPDTVLRYMVLTLLRPGERQTYKNFLARLYCHYGIAVEGTQLLNAMVWSGLPATNFAHYHRESWLSEMLRAGGFLTELSDACSIVHNPFGRDTM